ncbi:unnamed protein product [Heligmosomoides polygyrus]|uniref:Trafficking protein particle complex subunit n=1 Tax=Heligmosomoides polygyrus TaxID=6339 RepID=A0A183GBF2_HELPZ|nr:unnamed protein product [Heligmosomoides polygyrus]
MGDGMKTLFLFRIGDQRASGQSLQFNVAAALPQRNVQAAYVCALAEPLGSVSGVALDYLPRKLKIINITSRVYDYMVELNWDVEGKEFFSHLSFLVTSLSHEINDDIVAISWTVITPFDASLFPALAYEVRRTLAADGVETLEPAVTIKSNHVVSVEIC